jgi:hypothetical protein
MMYYQSVNQLFPNFKDVLIKIPINVISARVYVMLYNSLKMKMFKVKAKSSHLW